MSSIAGFFSPEFRQAQRLPALEQTAEHMLKSLSHRGPDCAYRMTTDDGILMYNGLYTNPHSRKNAPTQGKGDLSHLHIVCDDGIYNYDELQSQLERQQIAARELSRPEILLSLYRRYGEQFATLLRGSFAICIADTQLQKVILFRDPLGVKPLFYHQQDDLFLFASEIKGLFAHPQVHATMDLRGMHQVFSLGPAHCPGATVYKDIHEVRPGRTIVWHQGQITENTFWRLQAAPHDESYEETVEHAGFLLSDALHRQYHTDTAQCCLLSGGLDSSVVTALAHQENQGKDSPLITYSFDFTDSGKYFSANDFQPSLDRPYVVAMAEHFHTDHTFLECNSISQASLLRQAVVAHDGPCMADISSSLLYFCKQVAARSKVAFTGECADEIFCGYPWYHKKHMQDATTFPWTMDLMPRRMLLRDDFLEYLHMEDYIAQVYDTSCSQVSYLPEDSMEDRQQRRLFKLTTEYFMQTLLDRMDRAAAQSGMEAICPFADIRLVEYLYNVPWSMKAKDGEVKHLLRQIARPLLPATVADRKKSPYPKNYHPAYEQLLCREMKHLLTQGHHPILDFIDAGKTFDFCNAPKDYGKPWFGQLMAGPQLIAYYLQIDFWLREYGVDYTF